MVKTLPVVRKPWVRSLGWEDPLEKGMATHSSILAWRTPGMGSLVGYSPWGHKESGTTKQLILTYAHNAKENLKSQSSWYIWWSISLS